MRHRIAFFVNILMNKCGQGQKVNIREEIGLFCLGMGEGEVNLLECLSASHKNVMVLRR